MGWSCKPVIIFLIRSALLPMNPAVNPNWKLTDSSERHRTNLLRRKFVQSVKANLPCPERQQHNLARCVAPLADCYNVRNDTKLTLRDTRLTVTVRNDTKLTCFIRNGVETVEMLAAGHPCELV